MNNILVIGAHTDDLEISCGGTINRFIKEGKKISYVTFSFANKSLPDGFPPGTTLKEVYKASSILGVNEMDRYLYDYEVRVFPESRQQILEDLILIKETVKPDLVITHNSNDTHQDHKIVSDEVFRAFKQSSSIWGFESLKNNRIFSNDLYVTLSERNMYWKLEAVSQYKSQLTKGDPRDSIVGLACFRGSQVNVNNAECYEVMRTII